jgi:hypothetical protein
MDSELLSALASPALQTPPDTALVLLSVSLALRLQPRFGFWTSLMTLVAPVLPQKRVGGPLP